MQNITRIDTGNTHGWQVRFCRDGTRYSKFFSDRLHGSSEEALLLAKEHRDEKAEELPDRISKAQSATNAARSRATLGVPGISLNLRDQGDGKLVPYLQAYYTAGGKRKSKGYSLKKWTLRKAVWNASLLLHFESDHESRLPEKLFTIAHPKAMYKLIQIEQQLAKTDSQQPEEVEAASEEVAA